MEIESYLNCPLCLKPSFTHVNSLRDTLINVATADLSCPVCEEIFKGLDKFTIHLFSHMEEVVKPTSEENLEDIANASQEEYVNVNKSEIVCDGIVEEIICASKMDDRLLDISINNIDNEQICDIVEKPRETQISDEIIFCDICNFKFVDRNILEMHQKLLHQTLPDKKTGIYSYHCHLCSKKFKMKGSLMVHLRVAHVGFLTEKNANYVRKTDNSDCESNGQKDLGAKVVCNKQWECDVCSKCFTTKYFLRKHKRLHTGEMPYTCTQCNKSFTFQQSYHKHLSYHNGEKPHECTECGRCFKELSTLQNHARIHSGEKPFGCEFCDKRFRQRVSYLVHRRIHTGATPYCCHLCSKSFRYKVTLKSHKCTSLPGQNLKVSATAIRCVVSIDGKVKFFHKNFLPEDDKNNALNENEPDKLKTTNKISTAESPDFYSILSPLLPDVESLCLANSSKSPQSSSNENSLCDLLKN